MDRDAIQKYLDFHYEPLVKGKLVCRLVTVFLLTIVCCIMGGASNIWGVYLTICSVLITILFIFVWIRGAHNKKYKFLWDGITYLYLSFVLTLISYHMCIQNTDNNLALLLGLLFIFVINILFSGVLVVHNIQHNKYDSSNQTKVDPLIPYLFAIIGYIFIKITTSLYEVQIGMQIASISILVVSCIIGFGWTNLIRFILVRKQA